jgi:hypothetical protein
MVDGTTESEASIDGRCNRRMDRRPRVVDTALLGRSFDR